MGVNAEEMGKADKKTRAKKVFKDLLKSDAHVVLLIDKVGKIKVYTDIPDSREVGYVMMYVAKDIVGEDFDIQGEISDRMREAMNGKNDDGVCESTGGPSQLAAGADSGIDQVIEDISSGKGAGG